MLATTGRVLRRPIFYDLTVWLFTGGQELRFRERVVSLADLARGESVLDIGCGTGSQAIAAKGRVGVEGSVTAVDASEEMLDRARVKARKKGATVRFERALAEALPYGDSQFDVVLSTVMMHHLPKKARAQCIAEIRRVMKPGGRLLVVDFEGPAAQSHGVVAKFSKHKHGHVASDDLARVLVDAGLDVVRSGDLGISDLHFTLAKAPSR